MTGSEWLPLYGFRADVENLNSHNEAELRRQFEERQQETEHVYELLENKIDLWPQKDAIFNFTLKQQLLFSSVPSQAEMLEKEA